MLAAAQAFLVSLRRADAAGAPLLAFADDPDGFGAALAAAPEALGAALETAVDARHGAPVMLHGECFASAGLDRAGRVVVASAAFGAWFDTADVAAAVYDGAGGEPRVVFADDRSGRLVALAAARHATARHWPLDDIVRAALDQRRATHAVIAFRPGARSSTQAAATYGLTRAEAALVTALARTGDLQAAAQLRGVAYETARKFVAAAMRKTGTRRQTDLIRRTLSLAAGDVPRSDALERLLRDLFGLSERQARLALRIADGATRDEAAAALGIAGARAKADLKILFAACGIASAVDLARLVTEVEALHGLATACDVAVTPRGAAAEPLRLVPRRWASGMIAVADHGPASGVPVVLMHSNVSGRHHSRSFVAALQAAGFRPIAIERGGYGLSDPAPGDAVTAGVADFHEVLDALRLPRVAVVARCNTASLVACAAAPFGRIAGAVLIWPEALNGTAKGARMTDRGRALFADHPGLALGFARLMARRTSVASIERLWRKSAEGVACDEAVMENAAERADIIRGALQASAGLHGFLGETLALTRGAAPRRVADARRWTLLYGTGYEAADVADASAFWQAALPGATLRIVDDGVHFLHVTHTVEVVAALRRAFAPTLTTRAPEAKRSIRNFESAYAGGQG